MVVIKGGFHMTIGGKIQYYRKMNDYSQEDLAKKIGVSRQAISKWERDDSIPDLVNGTKLCSLFNITIEDLLNDSFGDNLEANESKQTNPSWKNTRYFDLMIKSVLILLAFIAFSHFLNLYLEKAKETYQFSFTVFYGLPLVPYFLVGVILHFKTSSLKESLKLLLAYAINLVFLLLIFSILTNPFLPIINRVDNMWLRSLIFVIFGIYFSYITSKSI